MNENVLSHFNKDRFSFREEFLPEQLALFASFNFDGQIISVKRA